MLSCLDNLVGVDKRCLPQESLSGLYLNDLPSFSLKIASATLNSEDSSAVGFAENMLSLARDEISQRFREYLFPYMKVTSLFENQTIGQLPDKRETLPVSKLGGWKVRVRSGDYLRFNLHSITLFWNTTATVEVKVYNILTGNLLDTFSVNVVANTPTEKIVSKTYSGNDIHLGIVTSGSGEPFKVTYGGCTTCAHSQNYAWFTPAEIDAGDAITDANFAGISHSYGMQINYSLGCDTDPFVCNMSPMLAYTLREGAAAQVFTAVLGSMERWNTYVTLERSKAEYWQQYHQGRFDKSLQNILQNLSIPECLCFYCNSAVRKVTQIP